ncbi:hypothetical protein VP01_1059g4, partial [Puccinia sorghi]
GLRVSKDSNNADTLVGYTDADWASCPESRRSVSGNFVLFNRNVIPWKSNTRTIFGTCMASAIAEVFP